MEKANRDNQHIFHRSKLHKKVIKRCDVPLNDIKNIEDAADAFLETGKALKNILNYQIPAYRKLACAQDEVQGMAIGIRWLNNPIMREMNEQQEITEKKIKPKNWYTLAVCKRCFISWFCSTTVFFHLNRVRFILTQNPNKLDFVSSSRAFFSLLYIRIIYILKSSPKPLGRSRITRALDLTGTARSANVFMQFPVTNWRSLCDKPLN